jgi:CRP-like cAMP-binding protein
MSDLIFKNVETVIVLTEAERSQVASFLTEQVINKRDYVLRAGEICRHACFVQSGCLRIFYTDEKGIEHVVKFAVENWWAFDLASFTTQTPAYYSIQALEPTVLSLLPYDQYEKLYVAVPAFERFFRIMFQQSYILLQQRLTQNQSGDAAERYAHFCAKYPGLDQRIPQKEIASYLGITPEFLSMLRRKWATSGIS